MALIRTGGSNVTFTALNDIVKINTNTATTLNGVQSGNLVAICKEDSSNPTATHVTASSGLTSLGFASISMGSVYEYLEVFIATADNPSITCNSSVGAFKIS